MYLLSSSAGRLDSDPGLMFQHAACSVPFVALGASSYLDARLLALMFSWNELFFAIILTRPKW